MMMRIRNMQRGIALLAFGNAVTLGEHIRGRDMLHTRFSKLLKALTDIRCLLQYDCDTNDASGLGL
jgi:hypothetical protein